MSISFGSTGRKPYVGSKEVQEAYVGSQKVYSAAPPIYYGFLGAENDYVLADWCALTQNAAIVKKDNVYRIGLTRASNYTPGLITLSEINGNKLKFVAKLGIINSTVTVIWRSGISNQTYSFTGLNTNNYNLCEWDVPAGASNIRIQANNTSYAGVVAYLDAIRFEEA